MGGAKRVHCQHLLTNGLEKRFLFISSIPCILRKAHQSKAHSIVPEVRIGLVAIGRAAALAVIQPAGAAKHALAAVAVAAHRVLARTGGVIGGIVPTLAPLPDIARHVVQPKGISRKTAHSHCLLVKTAFSAAGIRVIAVIIGLLRRKTIPGIETRVRPAPAGILPLALGRQAEVAAAVKGDAGSKTTCFLFPWVFL